MKAGELDRFVEIEALTEGQTPSGEVSQTWATYAQAWAKMRPTRGTEAAQDEALYGWEMVDFTIRWVAGITSKMRLLYDGKHYNIQSVKELGRNEGLILACKWADSEAARA